MSLLALHLAHLGRWPLADVLVLVALVVSVLGALQRRAGVGGLLGAFAGTLVMAWLVTVAVSTWAPRPLAHAADQSTLLQVAPVPHHAIAQANTLVHDLLDQPGRG